MVNQRHISEDRHLLKFSGALGPSPAKAQLPDHGLVRAPKLAGPCVGKFVQFT